MSTPIWAPGHVLLLSSAYNGGTRALKLERTAAARPRASCGSATGCGCTSPRALLVDGLLCGSSGDFGPAPFTAIDVATGAVVWRQRSVGRVTGVRGPNGVLLLDEDGQLLLADVTREGLTVRARAPVASATAWTAPAIAGDTRLRPRSTGRSRPSSWGQPSGLYQLIQ